MRTLEEFLLWLANGKGQLDIQTREDGVVTMHICLRDSKNARHSTKSVSMRELKVSKINLLTHHLDEMVYDLDRLKGFM